MDKPMSEWAPEEWGRAAVALPGWPHRTPGGCGRFESGIEYIPSDAEDWADGGAGGPVPNPDDATGATAGCLLALLGMDADRIMLLGRDDRLADWYDGKTWRDDRLPLGRACIAAAIALGRWPGGAK